MSEYEDQLRRQREQREEYFGTDSRSPIAQDQQGEAFPGLAFFPPDPGYRFELRLQEHGTKETVTVETSTNGQREYLRWGEFRFELSHDEYTLQAYRSDPGDDRLWVPFRDETNGEETYGAGRYLDLESDHHKPNSGEWVLDFNRAYNPTCAYNEAYECPLIPVENWLNVRIEAGEKDYPGEAATANHG
jgi:uncharacterized protein (DUF1684 family)